MELEALGVEPDREWAGDHYRRYVVDNVTLALVDDLRIFEEEADAFTAAFVESVRESPAVDTAVDLVDMERAAGDLLLDAVEAAARESRDHGLERYAVASADITKFAVKGTVDDLGLETFTTDEPADALAWARE